MNDDRKCPVAGGAHNHAAHRGTSNRDWWPNELKLNILRQHSSLSDHMDKNFNYAKEFKTLDLESVKKVLRALMTNSQDWWPADFGHYGPLFIRMAWHRAGTYRFGDGRGGAGAAAAFAPLTAGPTTQTSISRAGYFGRSSSMAKISWADLMILAGNVALSRWVKTFGFAGVADVWEPEEDAHWGLRKSGWKINATLGAGIRKLRGRADGTDLRQWKAPTAIRSDRGGHDIAVARMGMNEKRRSRHRRWSHLR